MKPKSTSKSSKSNKVKSSEFNQSLYYLLVFIIPVIVYLPTSKFGYTHFDDDGMITTNLPFLSNLKNIPSAFLTDQFINHTSLFYRPLGTVSYMIDIFLSGKNNVGMFHLSNVLFLGLSACALFGLLIRFNVPSGFSLLGSLFFCMNPLFVSTVAHIPNRSEIMMILFTILSFNFLIDFLNNRDLKSMLLNWIFFVLALFCKETAAFLPFVFLIYYFAFSRSKGFDKKYLISAVLYLIAGSAWYILRSKAIQGVPNEGDVFGVPALLLNLRVIPEAFSKFFIPLDFSPIPAFSMIKTIVGLVILGVLGYLYVKEKKHSIVEKAFGLSWFLILIVPSMLYKHPLIDYLDHRFMLPLIGVLVFILMVLPENWFSVQTLKKRMYMIAIIIVFGGITIFKSKAYADPITFYSTVIKYNSNSSIAYNNRAYLRRDLNDLPGALDDFNKSIEIKPEFAATYCNRGIIKSTMNDKKGAINDYDKAIQLQPDFAVAYNYRGILNNGIGDFDHAIIDYSNAIKFKPNYAEAYNNRAIAHSNKSDYDKALRDYNKAISINSDYSDAIYGRGLVYMRMKKLSASIADFDRAIQLQPTYAEAYNNKGIAQGMKEDYQAAVESFNQAIIINPSYQEALANRAMVKYNLNDFAGVLQDCEVVLKINPRNDKANYYRALAIRAQNTSKNQLK